MKPTIEMVSSRLRPSLSGGRYEIGGKYPGNLVGGDAETAKHMRYGYADDCDVEHLEDSCEHDGNNQRDRWPLDRFPDLDAGLVGARSGGLPFR